MIKMNILDITDPNSMLDRLHILEDKEKTEGLTQEERTEIQELQEKILFVSSWMKI